MNKEALFKIYKAITGSDVDSSPILADLLKNADPKFYRQIYKLCMKDQKCIASVLDHIAVLFAARKHDSTEKKERRKKSNAKSVKKHRSKKKLIKQLAGNFEFPDTDKEVEKIITILSKEVGKNTAKKLALKISHRNNLLDVLGVESTGDLLLPKHLPNVLAVIYNDPVADNKTDPPQTINFYRQHNKYWYYN